MKKLLFLSVLLVSFVLALPGTAYAEHMPADKEMDVAIITVWIAVPREYVGESHVYLHSNGNPSGTRVPLGRSLYSNEDWVLYRYYFEDMAPDTYWVTASTADDGEFFGDSAGTGFPDLNQRSLLPDIDTGVTSIEIATDLTDEGTIWWYELVPVWGAGFPQFFCIFDSIERFPETVSNIELIFTELMKEYAAYLDNLYGHTLKWVIDDMVPLHKDAGHFDDFIKLYQPVGYSVYEYAWESYNPALNDLIESRVLGDVFDKGALEDPESEYAESLMLSDPLRILKDWGWDIRYDTRNLEYNEDGDCITEFGLQEDETAPRKLLFPDLGDKIPDDLPLVVLPDGHVSPGGSAPSVTPGIPEKDHGEERIEFFPTSKPENPKTDDAQGTEPDTPAKSVPVIPIVAVISAVSVAGVTIFIKKRKL